MFISETYRNSLFSLQLSDREAVDYIVNPTDLMNLGKDTGRLDGRISSGETNNNDRDDDNDGNDNDNNNNDNNDDDDDEKDKNNGKRLRMSLQKGEVISPNDIIVFLNIFLYVCINTFVLLHANKSDHLFPSTFIISFIP